MRASRISAPLLTVLGALLWVGASPAQDRLQAPLPEPLTLEFALAQVDAAHPDLLLAAAERDIALAERERAASAYGFNASLRAEALWVEPGDLARDQSHNDSQIALQLNKRLYDFGHTRANLAAAEAHIDSQSLHYAAVRRQRALTILDRYLDVLLADLEFRLQDEAMAIAYVRLDRIRDRHELAQVSDVERLEIETDYQEARTARIAAQARQRTARVRLAEAMLRPGQLPSQLAAPDLGALQQPLPALNAVLTEVLNSNTRLQALHSERRAADARLRAAHSLDRPVLSGVAEATEYQRGSGSRDPVTAGLALQVPLATGGRSAAERARARAELRRQDAHIAALEAELREQTQLLWEEIQVLKASREEVGTRFEYRELYLDRSRALYEMEVRTDLGDAMVRAAEARLQEARLEYRLLRAWAQLNVLRGHAPLAAGAGVALEAP